MSTLLLLIFSSVFADSADSAACDAEVDGLCWNPLEDWCALTELACRPISEQFPEEIWECLGDTEPRYLWFNYVDEIDAVTYKHYDREGNLIGVVQTDGVGGVAWGASEGTCLAPAPALITPWTAPTGPCGLEAEQEHGACSSTGGQDSPKTMAALAFLSICLVRVRR